MPAPQTTDKTLLIKYATRGRTSKFMKNFQQYVDKLSGKHKVIFVVTMDRDDVSMNNDAVKRWFSKFTDVDVRIFYGESKGKIHAINADIPTDEWSLLISTADDMEILQDGYDEYIMSDFSAAFLDNTMGALNYNVDPRLEEKGPEGYKTLITLPVIGRDLYDKFGTIYNPQYKSEYCDDEQTQVFEKLGVLRHINSRPIIHKWSENQDALMQRNMQVGFSHDRELFLKRKAEGFPELH